MAATAETRQGLLEGKQVLVMGLLDTKSYAWTIGERAREEGASVIYTVQSERFRDTLLRRSFSHVGLKLEDYQLLPCDVTNKQQIADLFDKINALLHGLVHSIAYANPKTLLQETMADAPVEDLTMGFLVSTASLAFVVDGARDKLVPGSSILTMTFDPDRTYPNYNWMGVFKGGLEALVKYLARDLGPLGVRVNALSAGPQRTLAATHIPGFEKIADIWPVQAPLGWDLDEGRHLVAAQAISLLSELSIGITGEIVHIDGGFQSVSIPTRKPSVAEAIVENPAGS